jgi:hypothetical protein
VVSSGAPPVRPQSHQYPVTIAGHDGRPQAADRPVRRRQRTPWAIATLAPVPEDPAARQDWQPKAASIGAYRETCGYNHPADPIGLEPTHDAPDQRAAY